MTLDILKRDTYIFVLLFFVWNFSLVKAQELSELQEAVEEAPSDKEKFYALMKLSDFLSYSDTTQALQALQQANSLKKGDPYLEGIYLFYEAGIYFNYDILKSQKLYQRAETYLKWYTTPEAYRYRARLWHNFGVLEQYSGKEQNFLNITLEYCIPFAEKSGDVDLLIGYLTDVGMVFANNKEYSKAWEYYQKALNQADKNNIESESLLWTYLNMFDIDYIRANKKSISNLYNKIIILWKKFPNNKLTGYIYRNEARYFAMLGRSEDALRSIDKGIEFVLKNNILSDYLFLEYEKVLILKQLGRFEEAKRGLQKLLEAPINKTLIKNQLGLLLELADMEAKLNQYQTAYELMVKHRALKDSLTAENDKKMLADMEIQYRTAEKEKAILQLESKNKQNLILSVGGILVLFIVTAWAIYAWNVQKKRHKKDLLLRKQQQEIEITHAVMEGEQQERNRLARDLHDGLGGRITGIKMNAEMLAQKLQQKEDLQKIIKQMDIAIIELRNTAHNLEPSVLEKYGLQAAISDFCLSLQTKNQKIKLYTDGLANLINKKWQLSVYRIVQELVTNAVKHSEATEILLQCTFKDRFLMIEIEDNGKGFDPKTVSRNMGLNSIETRVIYLGGKMEIHSEKGVGTTINIECKI
ncbi:MAG: histidine kinase [Capnocytophaga sp.]|nr:histidine kinase [Capnocytophaga sp.]